MSYLSQPRVFFSGTFRADPSTVNNTPDNYNPNANFPPNNGSDVGNNVQLYWNPNGTGEFALDCTITKVCDGSGQAVDDHPLLGKPLVSKSADDALDSAKLVDLDPMQQNVTELWALTVILGDEPGITGDFVASAYSNAWVQVIDGRGDYAGSALYQSVLELSPEQLASSPALAQLVGEDDQNRLSISFVVRSFNSASINYLISDETLWVMNNEGVPESVTSKLAVIKSYNQGPHGTGTPGLIPSTSYFEKLVNSLLSKQESKKYLEQIKSSSAQPYTALTEFDFTYGQVFGVIGSCSADEPSFLTPDRMLTPPSVTADTASYSAYFAPFTVNSDSVIVNLGNALPSTQPASTQSSYVAEAQLGRLQLCYFKNSVDIQNAVVLGEIDYQDNDFYICDAALAIIPIDPEQAEEIKTAPLGIISTTSQASSILLQENADGYYMRANQFVFRMNPGAETTPEEPRGNTQEVEIYVRKFGQPVADTEIFISLMPSLESAEYTNDTLGTGGSSGLVNMGVPASALSFPASVTTDTQGVARFTICASNPGNPRGYLDGQIYFLQYGFSDSAIGNGYVQSPDNLISLHVYSQVPDFEDITWENFVKDTLGQYGKIYPIMSFLDLQNKDSVIANANRIHQALNRAFNQGSLMPVTRDLSASRLELLNRWLCSLPTSK